MQSIFSEYKIGFKIEYFELAMSHNSLEIAIYFITHYEDQIFCNLKRVRESVVQASQNSNALMKSKIYILGKLQDSLSFKSAK